MSNLVATAGNTSSFAPDITAQYGLTVREDAIFNVTLNGLSVSSQYFQDINQPAPGGAVPAKNPAHIIVDLAGVWQINPDIRVLASVSNLGDQDYYNRIRYDGIESGSRRLKAYVGLAVGL